MKIYCPNIKDGGIGGGWTFLRNFKKGMAEKVHFVDSWKESDLVFITGITMVDKNEIHEAHKAGKRIVLRVDNVPRKSRNRRSSPHERLSEFAKLADVVVYQSKWAEEYCKPLCGEGTVIYNGVDESIFKPNPTPLSDRDNRYLFAYHGNNDQKGFSHAHYHFEMIARKNPNAIFWFIYDFQRNLAEMQEANFDFWNGEKVLHIPKQETPEEMAEIMQKCKYLIYPAICDASPNVVLEARACGMEVLFAADEEMAGTKELVHLSDISLQRMCEEYYGVFQVILES